MSDVPNIQNCEQGQAQRLLDRAKMLQKELQDNLSSLAAQAKELAAAPKQDLATIAPKVATPPVSKSLINQAMEAIKPIIAMASRTLDSVDRIFMKSGAITGAALLSVVQSLGALRNPESTSKAEKKTESAFKPREVMNSAFEASHTKPPPPNSATPSASQHGTPRSLSDEFASKSSRTYDSQNSPGKPGF